MRATLGWRGRCIDAVVANAAAAVRCLGLGLLFLLAVALQGCGGGSDSSIAGASVDASATGKNASNTGMDEGSVAVRSSEAGALEQQAPAQRPLALSPWGLQQSGRYLLFATNGIEYTLDLDFSRKSLTLAAPGYVARRNFDVDPDDALGYVIQPALGQAHLGVARFRMTEDAAVGSFHFPVAFSSPTSSALQPFIAVRKVITANSLGYRGAYNPTPISRLSFQTSVAGSQTVVWQSMMFAPRGVSLGSSPSLVVCGTFPAGWTGSTRAMDQCAKSIHRTFALRQSSSNPGKWEAFDPGTSAVLERFYIAEMNGQLVMLNATTDAAAGTSSFQIGLPDTVTWPSAITRGASSLGSYVTTSIGPSAIATVEQHLSGTQSSAELSLASIPYSAYGMRVVTDSSGSQRGWMMRSTRLAVSTSPWIPTTGTPLLNWSVQIGVVDPPRPAPEVGPMTLKVRANGVEIAADSAGIYSVRSGDLVELESSGTFLDIWPFQRVVGLDWLPGNLPLANLRLGALGLTEGSAHTLTFQISNPSTTPATLELSPLESSLGRMGVKLSVGPGDSRNGTYTAYAVGGKPTQLTLDFDLKRYALMGLPEASYGHFEQDPTSQDAYMFRSTRMSPFRAQDLGFRLRNGLVVGNFPISADATFAPTAIRPFVASRSFVTDAAQFDGVYNTFDAMTDQNGYPRATSARQVRISQGGTLMETCQISFSTAGGCAAGQIAERFSITPYIYGPPGTFRYLPLGQDPLFSPSAGVAFQVARTAEQKVLLSSREATYASNSVYQIGLQDTTTWRNGTTYAGSTHLYCCGSATFTGTNYAGDLPRGGGPAGTLSYSVTALPGLNGVRAINAEGTARYFAAQNDSLAVLVSESENTATQGYLQIGSLD